MQTANNGSNGTGAWIMGDLSVEGPTALFRGNGKMFSLLLGSLNGVITEPEGGYVQYYEGLTTCYVVDAASNHVCNAWVTITGEDESGLKGDVNGDGAVNVSDVTAPIRGLFIMCN